MSSSVHSPTVTVMAAASTTTTAAKKASKLYYAMSHDAWFLIAAIIAALALLRLAAFVRRRRRQHRGRSSSSSSASSSVSTTNLLSFPRALFASLQNVLFLTSFPPTSTDGQRSRWLSRAWPYSMPIHELLWSIAYFAAVMVFGFYGSGGKPKPFANQHGYIAWSQIPLIIGLAGKNNVISFITGISYEKLNFLHRAAGRVCLVSSWIHIGGRIALGLKGKTAISQPYMIWGCFGIACLTLLTLGSLRPLRARFYEAFLMSHIVLVIGFLVAMWCHWDKFSYWIYSGIVIWSFDRLARLGRHIVLNRMWLLPVSRRRLTSGLNEAQLEVVGDECMRLTIKRPLMKWSAVPSIAAFPLEAHPFTIVNAPSDRGSDDDDVTFLLRVRDGFTKRLFMAAQQQVQAADEKLDGRSLAIVRNLPIYIEGPYGAAKSSGHHDVALFIAGGTGISFAFSRFCQLHREMRQAKARTRSLRLIWVVRSADSFEWIASLLRSHIDALGAIVSSDPESATQADLNVQIDVYISRSAGIVDGAATPITSDHSSSTSRAESLNEKRENDDVVPELRRHAQMTHHAEESEKMPSNTVDDTSDWSQHGVHVRFHHGRPDIQGEISKMQDLAAGSIETSKSSSLGVAVCGPSSLQTSVKQAVKRLRGVRRGNASTAATIDFEAETFGW